MNETLVRPEPRTSSEGVATSLELFGSPEAVWRCLMFYEDVPHKPWPLLRLLLPQPQKSEGDKLSVGSLIRCSYDRGTLVKRITRVEPMRFLGFEVVEQKLGIERHGSAVRGSYEFVPAGDATRVVLTTVYRGHGRPRFLWRIVEHYLCHRLHRHILRGMRLRLASEGPSPPPLSSGADDRTSSAVALTR